MSSTLSLGKASQPCRRQRASGPADPSPGPAEKVGCLLHAQEAGGEKDFTSTVASRIQLIGKAMLEVRDSL